MIIYFSLWKICQYVVVLLQNILIFEKLFLYKIVNYILIIEIRVIKNSCNIRIVHIVDTIGQSGRCLSIVLV